MVVFYVTLSFLFFGNIKAEKEKALDFLKEYNEKLTSRWHGTFDTQFKKATNISKENSMIAANFTAAYNKLTQSFRKRAEQIDLSNSTEDTKRQFRFILNSLIPKDEQIANAGIKLVSEMEDIYSTATIPSKLDIINSIDTNNQTNLSLDGYLNDIMAKSRDPNELLYVWEQWRNSVGPKIKDKFAEYIRINNIAAKDSNYSDVGSFRRSAYEVGENLQHHVEEFWEKLKPFYIELHAYVRYRLSQVYTDSVKDEDATPAHLLGNMWAQSWENIYPLVTPFPNEPKLDVSGAIAEKYTIKDMFKTAEEFFTSLGWMELPASFWTKSMFVKPSDRNVTCHPSAWDFLNVVNGSQDVRVKMCTKKDEYHFSTIHHELGHIYYFLLYWNQPLVYRYGANPGFHEAVGEMMILSVQTPDHLKKIGLLKNMSKSKEADINFLMKVGLERIPFIPYAYIMGLWSWRVYSGDITPDQYNTEWWKLRLKYQGVKPPIPRSEKDFDPGSKFHIAADVPYIQYFFSTILQFTFHKHACKKANYRGPLHRCSIYKSKDAGDALRKMLELGKSKPWPEALETLTGSKELSIEPINEYFKPLIKFLRKERLEKNYTLGWNLMNKNSSVVTRCSFWIALFALLILIIQ